MEAIPTENRAKGVKHLDLSKEELPSERALGVFWLVEHDKLGFKIQYRQKPASRRGILSTVSTVYDPLGFLSPFVLTAKILLQTLCHYEISGDNLRQWQRWLSDLVYLEGFEVPRCYKPKNFGSIEQIELHMFSDASDCGYGVVAYLRFVNVEGKVHCAFVLGKSRVAPLKKITVPRMELTAATLAVRLSKIIIEELDYHVSSILFWTDSMSVIRYIANETSRFHTFVANRISVIREATDIKQWRYVPTKCNPADSASRGLKARQLLESEIWFQGPPFLWESETKWPQIVAGDSVMIIPDNDPEVKSVVTSTLTTAQEHEDVMNKLMVYFSDWMKLKRAVGWILLVIDNLKRRNKNLKAQPRYLSKDILDRAEESVIRYVQRVHFPDEVQMLSHQENVKRGSVLQKLDPIVRDGIVRVGGRLNRADIPFNAKHPIILPKKCHVSSLILKDVHEEVGHLGKNTMLAQLREKYWILGAGSAIKSLVSKCVMCRKYQVGVAEQKMSDLPLNRVTADEPPFSHIGIDYFGPILVKRGRSEVKRYGVVFTCFAIRAIHLEVACSLDTDSCVNAIRRFIARRGPVKSIRSDNGTNLVGCERELREEIARWNSEKIHKTLLQKGISWEFNPPAASHQGGVWERMIRSVRKVFYSLLQQQLIRLDDEALQTLFCEVEAILNNRPITTVPNDPNDLCALTPNHLLLLRQGETMPPGIFDRSDNYVRRRWRQVQYLADTFWKRWVKEYLPLLQVRQKWTHPHKNLKVGDIVLVVDNTPRNSWALVRVLEVFADKKGLVRVVKVKTQSTVLLRPIAKLCMILEAENSFP